MDFIFPGKNLDINKAIDNVDSLTKDYLDKYGVKYIKEFTKLAGIVYPYLSEKSLLNANLIHIFLWLLDDQVDDPAVTIETKIELLDRLTFFINNTDREILPTDNLAVVILNALFKKIKSKEIIEYLEIQLKDYFAGIREHISLENYKILSVEDYTRIRKFDGACEVVWALCFLDEDFTPFRNALESPIGLELREAVNINVSYVNDILSYDKDLLLGDNFNVVICYMNEHSVSKEEAIKVLVDKCNKRYQKIIMTPYKNDTITVLVERLAIWCRGSLEWHLKSKRYNLDV